MKTFTTFLAICIVAGATVVAGDVDLKNVQCVVANKAANAAKSADYKDGKVYFCCGGCAGKFASNTKQFSERANHQLVATKQYTQKGCPFSGGAVKAGKMVKIAGTEVGFCCDGCGHGCRGCIAKCGGWKGERNDPVGKTRALLGWVPHVGRLRAPAPRG